MQRRPRHAALLLAALAALAGAAATAQRPLFVNNKLRGGAKRGACTQLPTRDLSKATGPQTYLYVFAGPDRPSPENPDFLVTIDATGPIGSEEFGAILATTDIPSPLFGAEPHHVGVSGDVLAAGGLFAYRPGDTWPGQGKAAATPDAYFFNISKATAASPESGAAPGKLAEIAWVDGDRKWEVVAEHDGGVGGGKDATFTPHGFDRNGANGGVIVTADYVRADSTWRPSEAFKWSTTVRVWDLESRKVVAKWDLASLPSIRAPPQGLMSVRWTGSDQLFWFSAGTGSLYLVNASKCAADGIAAAVKEVYTLEPTPVYGSCVFSGRFANNTRLLLTSLALNEVRLLDTTDPFKLNTIQASGTYTLPESKFGTPQPHVVVTDASASIAAVTTYYVEQDPKNGLWTEKASKQLDLFSIAADKDSFAHIKTVDFNTAFEKPICGGVSPARGKSARPHGAVFVTRA
ncbi:MAG: hypothetical protein J3K34DRAFT_394534 [Monoraphidium minutum]|nr:MAG: hypothetical protein J3K34DRAFT_394534 [Monoraphidium minutum]